MIDTLFSKWFGFLFKKKEVKYPLSTTTRKMVVMLNDFNAQKNTYAQLCWLANLILEARTCDGVVRTAMDFLRVEGYYRELLEKTMKK